MHMSLICWTLSKNECSSAVIKSTNALRFISWEGVLPKRFRFVTSDRCSNKKCARTHNCYLSNPCDEFGIISDSVVNTFLILTSSKSAQHPCTNFIQSGTSYWSNDCLLRIHKNSSFKKALDKLRLPTTPESTLNKISKEFHFTFWYMIEALDYTTPPFVYILRNDCIVDSER